jgi:glutamate dehydrogenase/leucine dehydrogenase
MFEESGVVEHERVVFFNDVVTGASGVVAIHSTALGPAMGGLRLRRYRSLGDAYADALDLAKAMSLKSSAAGLDLGGGKAVMLDDGGRAAPAARAARMRAWSRSWAAATRRPRTSGRPRQTWRPSGRRRAG